MTETANDQQMSFANFLARAALWGVVGSVAGLRGSKLGWCAFLGPIGEKALGFSLEDIAAAIEQERQERERQEMLARIRAALQSISLQPTRSAPQAAELSPQAAPTASLGQKLVEIEKDSKWREVVNHPSILLILGKRGSGKSALGYRLLELFRYRLTPYVLGTPKEATKILPDWIGIAQSLEEIPLKSIVLVDEAYLRYHSRESLAAKSRAMSRILNLSRQREQTLVFVSQEARQVDKNIASSANAFVFKDLGMLQPGFDKPELNKIATQAKQAFDTVKSNKRSWSYAYSPDADFVGLLENSLPSFWRNKLSHIFAADGQSLATKLPQRMTHGERIQKARELHQGGLSLGQIAKMLGVAKGTAHNYVKGYPYKVQSS